MSSTLELPRFRIEELNPRLAGGDIGDAFQRFVWELLEPDYPELHAFPGGGKDGCIDLVCPRDEPDTIFECKVIGSDDMDEALKRWRSVAEKLSRNLAGPAGPPAGEPQYGPWYRSDVPIRQYVFCISSRLTPEQNRRRLLDVIHNYFKDLSARHAHLRHLAGIQVALRDWADLEGLLVKRPHQLFRWFPKARPRGLVPLGEEPAGSRFSEYLSSERLPYYSRHEHLVRHPAPPKTSIPDELALLGSFEAERVNGLVITGGGGFGKTRLMLELGQLAQAQGWAVFRVQGRLRVEALEELADRLRPDTPALLLIDYVEIQPAYGELIETLNLLVDERKLKLCYVSCCRSSFYSAVQLLGSHRRIDLFPKEDAATDAWLEGFRERAVRHIVTLTRVPSPDQVVAMCRATPVLAVFAAWLHAHDRGNDLRELLKEPDFGTWVHKRIRQSFPEAASAERLGTLVALFPIPDRSVDELDEPKRQLLNRLAQDGWVERVEEGSPTARWEVAHDVLADQVLSSYLSSIPATARKFVRDLFREAGQFRCIDSALAALQRVGSHPALADLDWAELISESMEHAPEAWRTARLAVLRSPLLGLHNMIEVLARAEEAWRGAESEVAYQNALGWIVRAVVGDGGVEAPLIDDLKSRLRHSAAHVNKSNYLLTQGLRLDPDGVRDAALRWLLANPALFQTHYLVRGWLVAHLPASQIQDVVLRWLARLQDSQHASFVLQSWLDAGGDRDLVVSHVSQWLGAHSGLPEAGFVLKSWLDAGGDRDLVVSHVGQWLASHGGLPEAHFVLKSWLDAGGDRDLIVSHVSQWLGAHSGLPEAGFVLKSWLDAGGDRDLVVSHVGQWLDAYGELLDAGYVLRAWMGQRGDFESVRSASLRWLHIHRETSEAAFVIKFLGRQPDLPLEAVEDILVWCSSFPEHADAIWRLASLKGNLLRPEIADQVVRTVERVGDKVLASKALSSRSAALLIIVLTWVAKIETLRQRTEPTFKKWFLHPTPRGESLHEVDESLLVQSENPNLVFYLADLVLGGQLRVSEHKTAFRRFFHWVSGWTPDKAARVGKILETCSPSSRVVLSQEVRSPPVQPEAST